jgi:hypothetical protein
MNLRETLKLLVILAQAHHEAFAASATFARYTAEGVDITLMRQALRTLIRTRSCASWWHTFVEQSPRS